MIYSRLLDLKPLLEKKSYFLFGPRSTGKTTLIRNTLPTEEFPVINLLHAETRLRLLHNPSDLSRMLEGFNRGAVVPKAIVIDEIQKIPDLLDEVHNLIESRKIRFLLTGSSARRLKRKGANLLAGRARIANLFPLVFPEIPKFNQERFLHLGGLPGIITSDAPWEDLRAYVDTYLREEIEQEAQVRQLGQFSRFLYGAALHNGELLNFAAVGNDVQISESTVRSYYSILVDTLVGTLLEPYRESRKRKAIQTAKFYFFDTGVTHAILNMRTLERASSNYGNALEQWVFMELRAYLFYNRIDEPLRFWRSVNGQEVDFVIGNRIGIEVKAKNRVQGKDLSGLKALAEERGFEKFFLISNEPNVHRLDGVECLPLEAFMERLWAGKIVR